MPELMPNDWIIAHRCVDLSAGLTDDDLNEVINGSKLQENTLDSMGSRFGSGFGIETDLRHGFVDGGVIITHDPAKEGVSYPTLAQVFELYTQINTGGCLALNVKDTAFQTKLNDLFKRFPIKNYYTFDGAVPDVWMDGKSGITAFTRESELEPWNAGAPKMPLSNYGIAAGVWLDQFEDPAPAASIIDRAMIEKHFKHGKDVAIVSPELHPWGRGPTRMKNAWAQYRDALKTLRGQYPDRRMMICTKFGTAAQQFFNA